MKKLRVVGPLGMDVVQDENYNYRFARNRGQAGESDLEEMGLYQVVSVVNRIDEKAQITTEQSIHMVLAESEDGAISQIDDLIAKGGCLSGLEARQSGKLIMSAKRVPFHIRGWGNSSF